MVFNFNITIFITVTVERPQGFKSTTRSFSQKSAIAIRTIIKLKAKNEIRLIFQSVTVYCDHNIKITKLIFGDQKEDLTRAKVTEGICLKVSEVVSENRANRSQLVTFKYYIYPSEFSEDNIKIIVVDVDYYLNYQLPFSIPHLASFISPGIVETRRFLFKKAFQFVNNVLIAIAKNANSAVNKLTDFMSKEEILCIIRVIKYVITGSKEDIGNYQLFGSKGIKGTPLVLRERQYHYDVADLEDYKVTESDKNLNEAVMVSVKSSFLLIEAVEKYESTLSGFRQKSGVLFSAILRKHYPNVFFEAYMEVSNENIRVYVDFSYVSTAIVRKIYEKDPLRYKTSLKTTEIIKIDKKILDFFLYLHIRRVEGLASKPFYEISFSKTKVGSLSNAQNRVYICFQECFNPALFISFNNFKELHSLSPIKPIWELDSDGKPVIFTSTVSKKKDLVAVKIIHQHSLVFKKDAMLVNFVNKSMKQRICFDAYVMAKILSADLIHVWRWRTYERCRAVRDQIATIKFIETLERKLGLTVDWSFNEFFSFYKQVYSDVKVAYTKAIASSNKREIMTKTIAAIHYYNCNYIYPDYVLDNRGRCYDVGLLSLVHNKFCRFFVSYDDTFYLRSRIGFGAVDVNFFNVVLPSYIRRAFNLYYKPSKELKSLIDGIDDFMLFFLLKRIKPPVDNIEKIVKFAALAHIIKRGKVPVIQIDARASIVQIIALFTGDETLIKLANFTETKEPVSARDILEIPEGVNFSNVVKKEIFIGFIFGSSAFSVAKKLFSSYGVWDRTDLDFKALVSVLREVERNFHKKLPIIRALQQALVETKHIPWVGYKKGVSCHIKYIASDYSRSYLRVNVETNQGAFENINIRPQYLTPGNEEDVNAFSRGALPNLCHFLDSNVIVITVSTFEMLAAYKYKSHPEYGGPDADINKELLPGFFQVKCVHDCFFVNMYMENVLRKSYNKSLLEAHSMCFENFKEVHIALKKLGFSPKKFNYSQIKAILTSKHTLSISLCICFRIYSLNG